MSDDPARLRVNEIFCSIQGESTFAGRPCVFVRTSGCPLRCRWCDTRYAFDEGTPMELEQVLQQVQARGVPLVALTGGEPLIQPAALPLMGALCDAGAEVLLETSGALDIGVVDPRVHVVLDVKCPGSGMQEHNRWDNLALIRRKDEVKFVVAHRGDYDFARDVIAAHRLAGRCELLLAPAFGLLEPRQLARWMLADRLLARLQLQLHKQIWPPDARGV